MTPPCWGGGLCCCFLGSSGWSGAAPAEAALPRYGEDGEQHEGCAGEGDDGRRDGGGDAHGCLGGSRGWRGHPCGVAGVVEGGHAAGLARVGPRRSFMGLGVARRARSSVTATR